MPPGWVDLAVGEAHVVRYALQLAFPPHLFNLEDVVSGCDYQAPEGYMPLVEVLERRHGAHVVITSGAKQGLIGVFYALKKLRGGDLALRAPYWSQMPEAIRLGGLGVVLGNEPTWGCSYLIVSPNNPDGHVTSLEEARVLRQKCDKLGTFLVHDAAYYQPIYMGDSLPELADITVYSASKAYGLSGLRVGYVVCRDPRVKQLIADYVEASSVGVSLLSQKVMYNIIEHENNHPQDVKVFTTLAKDLLDTNKKVVATLHPDVLDASVMPTHGIFGWFKPGPRFNPDEAMVRIPPGSAFGDATRARINLAIDPSMLSLAVERLNTVK